MAARVWTVIATVFPFFAWASGAAAAEECKVVTLSKLSGRIVKIEPPESKSDDKYAIDLKLHTEICESYRRNGVYVSYSTKVVRLLVKRHIKDAVHLGLSQNVVAYGHFEAFESGFGFDHTTTYSFVVDKIVVRF